MIILDTQKAASLFAKFDVPLLGYLVNRVIPPERASQNIPDYLVHRLEMQKDYLTKIDKVFGGRLWHVFLNLSVILPDCP